MIRGEIWWANLPITMGSTPSKRRPVLIIQSKDDLTELVAMLPKHIVDKVNNCLKTVLEIL